MSTTFDWDAHAASVAMDDRERIEEETWRDPDAVARIFDKMMVEQGIAGDYLSLEFNDKVNAVEALSMDLPHDSQFYDHFFRNPDGEDAMIPVTVDTDGGRWAGMCDRVALVQEADGTRHIEVSALSMWNHIATTCFWASPFAPILAQLPRHDIKIGPVISVGASYLATNRARIQMSSAPPQFDDDGSWIDFGSAMFPVAVVPVDTLHDTSQWCAYSARFDMGDKVIQEISRGTGVVWDAELFLPGDEQPAPEWFYLDRPTIVIKARDQSNIVGPTGTLLDGITSWFESFLDDNTTPVRYPNFGAESDWEKAYETGPLGTKRFFPWVWYFEGEYSGIGQAEIAVHKPMATRVLVGGRSPSWVNAAIEIAIKNMLSWLGLLLGIPGLDALYRGQLDDVFLAFMVYEDVGRTVRAGPYAWSEFFVTGSEKAFTLDGVVAGLKGLHETRGYTSKKATVRDREPYIYGLHMRKGQQIGFALADLIFVDYISEATFRDTRTEPSHWELTIGDGAADESPIVKGWARMGQLAQIVATLSKDVGMEADFLGIF